MELDRLGSGSVGGEKVAGSSGSRTAQGILRLDAPKPHRIAVQVQSPGEPSSPQPSVDRLSVSFAPDYYDKLLSSPENVHGESGGRQNEEGGSSSVKVFNMSPMEGSGVPSPGGMSTTSPPHGGGGSTLGGPARLSVNLTDEEDDYSASMNVILQRRASQRKVKGLGKRRTSSPYDSDRRRSSVFTTSSAETAITMEGGGGGDAATQEQIFENIRLHKELLDSVKQQPWDMRRKLKLIQQAKEYVKRHEGQLQERLAQSKSTKDIMARFKLILLRFWQQIRRELSNLLANMVPWEQRIKDIESHFGSVVASYFTFLRWVFWINIVISAILICFVMLPEILAADTKQAGQRKILLPSEEKTAANLGTLWEFEGAMKHSPMFYGYYTDQKKTKEGYPLPLFYFVTTLGVYIYSFVAILRRMAANARQSKLSDKEDECAFSWRLFTAWDYMIGNPETAFNRFASITMGFKEALLEEKEKTKDERNWKVISLRVLANFLILLLLMFSAFAVIQVVERSANVTPDDSWWRQNEITLTLSLITTIFPNIFELVGMLENYHPRKQLRWQLARIMVLNFLNLYTLIFALFGKVSTMTEELQALRLNQTTTPSPNLYLTTTEPPPCTDIVVNCTLLDEYASYVAIKETKAVLVFVANLTTLLPNTPEYPSTSANFPFLNTTSNAAGKFNMTEWWAMVHNFGPRTDLASVFNQSNTLSSSSSSSADFSSESWSEYLENENYTFWTNQSSIDLNDTTTGLWVPENKTALVTAFPIIIKLINAYLATLIPTITKTTPFVGDYSTNDLTNTTIDPHELGNTIVGHSSSIPPGNGGTTLIPSDFTAFILNVSMRATKKPKLGRKKARKMKMTMTSRQPPNSSPLFRSKRQFVPWQRHYNYESRYSRDNNEPSTIFTKMSSTTPSMSSTSSTTSSTEPPDEDYTQPDWSKYPVVSGEIEPLEGSQGQFSGASQELADEVTTEDDLLGMTTESGSGSGENATTAESSLKGDGSRKYWMTKQTTRGDIPSEWDEEITTSTTTEMTPTSTTMAPTTTEPETLERFLTNVLTMVTLIFSHNSTKTDEIDYSRIKDFSKWITTLESVVETKKVTQAYLNSTFGTTVKVNVDEKEVKTCYVTICEDGTTVPKDIGDFLNCSTDIMCSLETLLGPRIDNCWIPRSSMCITTTEPPPTMDPDISIRLRKLCWETMFGQEIVKLTVMDLIITVVFILVLDFIRAILVRILNPCWCWDLEKTFPQYGDFKIAENILHLVNNQGMIWMGMFFSPGLPTLNLVKLVILLYIRSWAVMTCNVPHETVFRASRSNNFYFALLLFMLFLCTLPVAYAVVWLEPSWHCGPFSHYERIYHILTQAILAALPKSMHKVLDYIASPGIVIPLLVLLVLIIYYLLSLTGALREANNDLKTQLRRERTEERRKMFKLAGGKKKDETPLAKWAMLIPMAKDKDPSKGSGGGPAGGPGSEKRSSILTTGKMTGFAGAAKRAALKAKQQEQEKGEGSPPDKHQKPPVSPSMAASIGGGGDDDGNATDVDQASLPEDHADHAKTARQKAQKGATRKPSCTDSVASTRSEIPVIKISEEEESGKGQTQGATTAVTTQPTSEKVETAGDKGAESKEATASPGSGRSSSPIEPEKRKRVMKALIKASKEKAADEEHKDTSSKI